MNGLAFSNTSRLNYSFNRGRGGLTLSGEFRTAKSNSSHRQSVQPNFIPSKVSLGSIGWGLTPKLHSVDTEKRSLSTFSILKSLRKTPTLVKSKDRFHIKRIDKDHNITGAVGFMRLPGKLSSKVDRELKMDNSTFTRMNINYQRK